MTWWDFLSDFIGILNTLFHIELFSVDVGLNDFEIESIDITIGGLLVGLFMICTILFYLIPRR